MKSLNPQFNDYGRARKIRFRDFLKQKAIEYKLKPRPTEVFLAEFDLDKQDEGEQDLATALVMELNTYKKHKTNMYNQLEFPGTGYKREDFLRQLLKEFSESPAEQERKRLEIEALNSQSQSLLLSHNQLGALVAAVKAGRKLQETEAPADIKMQTVCRLWQVLYKIRERNRFHRHGSSVYSVSFSPDGQMIASASRDCTVKLWRKDGTFVQTCSRKERGLVYSVSFSPDGQMITFASSYRTVELWHLDDDRIQTFRGHRDQVYSVSFSPDSQRIASASDDGIVKFWKKDGTKRASLQMDQPGLYSLSFSPEGKTIALASRNGIVKLRNIDNIDDGKELPTFRVTHHSSWVTNLSFSPNGEIIASASHDGIVKLWNLDGKEIQSFKTDCPWVNTVSFSRDGKTLAFASADGTVILWNLNLDDLLIRACNWLQDYLKTNPNVSESDRHLCDGIGTQK